MFGRVRPFSLYNFGRGQYEEYNCEIILNLDKWLRIRLLKVFINYLEL